MTKYTTPENVTSIEAMFTYANSVSDGLFGVGTLIALYLIVGIYLKSRGEEASASFVVAGFITSMAGILFFMMGLIENWHLFLCFLLLALPIVWNYLQKD